MATYYIDPAGNDTTGNGSSGNPWLTLDKADTAASDGDTIICNDGTYTWVDTQIDTDNLTIQAANDLQAIFDAGGADVYWQLARTERTCSVTGIKFLNGYGNLSGANKEGIFTAERNIDICHWTFTRCWFGGIKLATDDDEGGLFGTGVNSSSDFTIESCVFDDPRSLNSTNLGGIFTGRGGTFTVRNSTFYFNATGVNALDYIFQWQANSPAITFQNCIASSDGDSVGAFVGSPAATFTTSYNCWNNMTDTNSGTGDVTADPLFVDGANSNFNLRPTSPCIDAGVII